MSGSEREAGLAFLGTLQSLGDEMIYEVPAFAKLVGEKVLRNHGKAIAVIGDVVLDFVRGKTQLVPIMVLPPNRMELETVAGEFVRNGFEIRLGAENGRLNVEVQVGAVRFRTGKIGYYQNNMDPQTPIEVCTILHESEGTHLYRSGNRGPENLKKALDFEGDEPDILHITPDDQYTQTRSLTDPILMELGRAVVERQLDSQDRVLGRIIAALGVVLQ